MMRAARRLGPALAAAALLPALISLLVPATGETAYNAGRQGMPGVAPLSDAAKLSEAANAAADAARREAGEALPPPTMEELRQLDRMRYGFLNVNGAVTPYEFFRATFGGLIGCGESPMVLPPEDNYELCAPVDAASEAAAAMIGAYVFVLRGKCTFVEKARVAQAAGARGLIVANLEPGLLRMPAGAQDARGLSLSVVMVGSKAGDVIHHAATSGVPLSATLVPSGEACVDDGYGGPGDYADAWGADADEWEVDARDESGGVASYAALQSGDVAAAGIVTVRPPPADGTNDFEFYTMDFGGLVLPGYRELAVAEPALACAPLADDRVRGKWAIVHRGTCPMIDKARHAQRVGAAGVILVNTGFNGPVRALGDDNWMDVLVPVVSVSPSTGERLEVAAAAGASATTFLRDVPKNVWEELEDLAQWPADKYGTDEDSIRMTLSRLVRTHHPESASGHWERLAALRELVGRAGHGALLAEVEMDLEGSMAAATAEDAADEAAAALARQEAFEAHAREVAATGIAPLVINQFGVGTLSAGAARTDAHPGAGLLCSHISGDTYSVKVAPFDESKASSMDPSRQIMEALRSQACLEKMLLQNGEYLGRRLRHFKSLAESPKRWKNILRRAFHLAAVPADAEHMALVEERLDVLTELAAEREALPPDMEVKSWLEGAEGAAMLELGVEAESGDAFDV